MPHRARRLGIGTLQVAVAAAVFLIIAAVAAPFALSREQRVAATNGAQPDAWVVELTPGRAACQSFVDLPEGTVGVRVFVGTYRKPGPPLAVSLATIAGKVVRRGILHRGYRDASWQVVPIEQVEETQRGLSLCFETLTGKAALAGSLDRNTDSSSDLSVASAPVAADIAFRFVRPGKESLLELTPTIFHRAALWGPSWAGAWAFYAAAAIVVLAAAGGVAILVAVGRGRIGRRGVIAALMLLGFVNAAVWALVMAPFHPPDEAAHFAYVESLAEHHRRPYTDPSLPGGSYSARMTLAVQYTILNINQHPERKPPWTEAEHDEWAGRDATIATERPDLVGGGYTEASSYSPLYYALGVPAYLLAPSNIFDRLWFVRMTSALLAGVLVVFAYLFAREVAPSVPWAAPVAALTVAFQPMLAQMGGAVNNDILVFLFGTIVLYLLARAFRRGLTVPLAITVALAFGLGVLSKPAMYAFAPVVAASVGWVLVRDRPWWRATPLWVRGAGTAVGALALVGGVIAAGMSGSLAAVGAPSAVTEKPTPEVLRGFLSYLWQWYLPAVPSMHEFWPPRSEGGLFPLYDIYLKGFWAAFAQLETEFPEWVYVVLATVLIVIGLLACAAVWRARTRLATANALLCAGSVAAIALLVNVRSYFSIVEGSGIFAQGRYLLQAVAVVGVVVMGAALAFGERRGILVGTAIVSALAAFNMLSLCIVLLRFYA